MMRYFAAAAALAAVTLTGVALPGPATARDAAAVRPVTVTVSMADRHFTPQVIRLRRGVAYRLRLVNPDGTGHDFDAPGFFRASKVLDADMPMIRDGRVDVPAGEERTINVIPQVPAPFDLKSTKLLDVAGGMQGQILVY